MYEEWKRVGSGCKEAPFEIEPGVNVWDYQWYSDGGGKVQLGSSPTGPFLYLSVHVIVVDGRRITFAADDVYKGMWEFYLKLS